MRNTYKQITFAKGYKKPFQEFKEEFKDLWVFARIKDPKEKNKALKAAHKEAVKEHPKSEENGNTSGAVKESKESKSK